MDMGSKWHALVDFQDITHDAATAGTNDNSRVWAGVLTYGASSFSKPHSWDAWIEYVNADAHSLYGSTDTWRNNNLLDNVASWGIGFDYTLMNNTKLQFFQTFGSKAKNSSISYDPKEETRVEVMFVF
jgi:hypothetical protein